MALRLAVNHSRALAYVDLAAIALDGFARQQAGKSLLADGIAQTTDAGFAVKEDAPHPAPLELNLNADTDEREGVVVAQDDLPRLSRDRLNRAKSAQMHVEG